MAVWSFKPVGGASVPRVAPPWPLDFAGRRRPAHEDETADERRWTRGDTYLSLRCSASERSAPALRACDYSFSLPKFPKAAIGPDMTPRQASIALSGLRGGYGRLPHGLAPVAILNRRFAARSCLALSATSDAACTLAESF